MLLLSTSGTATKIHRASGTKDYDVGFGPFRTQPWEPSDWASLEQGLRGVDKQTFLVLCEDLVGTGTIPYRTAIKRLDRDPTLKSAPSQWIPVDFEDETQGDVADLSQIWQLVSARLPTAFQGCGVLVQASSSTGLTGKGARARLWFRSAHAVMPRHMRQVLEHVPGVDESIYSAAQPIYVAAPVFEGVADPCRERFLHIPGGDVNLPPYLEPRAREGLDTTQDLPEQYRLEAKHWFYQDLEWPQDADYTWRRHRALALGGKLWQLPVDDQEQAGAAFEQAVRGWLRGYRGSRSAESVLDQALEAFDEGIALPLTPNERDVAEHLTVQGILQVPVLDPLTLGRHRDAIKHQRSPEAKAAKQAFDQLLDPVKYGTIENPRAAAKAILAVIPAATNSALARAFELHGGLDESDVAELRVEVLTATQELSGGDSALASEFLAQCGDSLRYVPTAQRWFGQAPNGRWYDLGDHPGAHVLRFLERKIHGTSSADYQKYLRGLQNKVGGTLKALIANMAPEAEWLHSQVELSLTVQVDTYADGRIQLAACPIRDLEPEWSATVDTFLINLCGGKEHKNHPDDRAPQYDLLLDWLSQVPRLEAAAPALYLYGRGGLGKTPFAQAVARLWNETGSATAMGKATSRFNESLTSNPIVLADETLPRDSRGYPDTTTFREFVLATAHQIERKGKEVQTLRGAVRVFVTENGKSMFRLHPESTVHDVQAVGERLLCVDCTGSQPGFERIKYTLDNGHVFEGDTIARHVLWLASNRPSALRGRQMSNGAAWLLSQQTTRNMSGDRLEAWRRVFEEVIRGGAPEASFATVANDGTVLLQLTLFEKECRMRPRRVFGTDLTGERRRLGGKTSRQLFFEFSRNAVESALTDLGWTWEDLR